MKKILIAVIAISLAVIFVAADDSFLYLDGNASVGREGELPKGLFVKASGYLPGDNVSVTNPMTGETLELLNLGSMDASSGSIMLLSKEAAEGLGISPDANLKIKLSSRKGSFDQSAAGVGIVSSIFPGDVAYTKPASGKNTSYEYETVSLPPSADESDEDDEADEAVAYETLPADASAKKDDDYEEIAALEPMSDEELAKYGLATEDGVGGEPVSDSSLIAKENTKTEKKPQYGTDSKGERIDSLEPVKEEEASAIPYGSLDSDFDGEKVAYNEPLGSEYVAEEEIVRPISSNLIAALDPSEEDDGDEVLAEEEAELVEDINEPVAIVIPVNPDAGPETDFAGEEIVAAEPIEGEPVAKIELTPPEEDKDEEEVASVEPDEPYTPIVLVPSDDLTPPKEEKKPVEIKPTPQKNKTPTKDIAARLRKESELDRSRYYVQIATLAENSSAQALIDKYGKYPLIMIQNSRGAYRVLVGPLSVDEYGMILERFKCYGFKDAFVKYPGSV
ncbi:MAG: SPOR domain-containing protein [Treponema sp.]|nr:SPOR domain-containing protein [Treponema sp.]